MSLATLLYCGKGFYHLTIFAPGGGDLRARWVEQRYVFSGRNPTEMGLAVNAGTATPEMYLPGMEAAGGGYPPWAYFTGAIFLWPSWMGTRYYFALLDIVSLALLFWWGYRIGWPYGKLVAWTFGLCGISLSSYATTIALGQYGLPFVALLALMMWLVERKQPASAGVAFAVAMTKPMIPPFFVLPFVFRWSMPFLVATTIYMLIANGVVWAVVGTDPVTMLRQMLKISETYADISTGPLNLLLAMGVPTQKAVLITAAVFSALAVILLWIWRGAPLLVQFAIAAVCGRLFTYHKFYDNLMLIFLLIALGELAVRTVRPIHIATFLAVWTTLLAPTTIIEITAMKFVIVIVWLMGLGVLLAATPTSTPKETQQPLPQPVNQM